MNDSLALAEASLTHDLLGLPTTRRHRRVALTWAAVAGAIFIAVLPFGWNVVPAEPHWLLFSASATSAIGLAALITAYLLFRQFTEVGRLTLELLAYAYYTYGLLSFAQVCVMPWPNTAEALGGPQASPWLWVLRHAAFGAFFMAGALLRPRSIVIAPRRRSLWTYGMIIAAPLAIAALVFAFIAVPQAIAILVVGNAFTPLYIALAAIDWCLCLAALAGYVLATKLRGIIRIWLAVALFAFLTDISTRLLFPGRGNVASWVSLLEGVISSFAVLWVFLQESERLRGVVSELRDRALDVAKQKSDILSTMSHEIRTPVNAIIGMTDLLMNTPLNEQQREYGTVLQNAGEALLSLIDDILDLSKLEADKLQLDEVRFDPWAVVEQTLDLVTTQAAKKRLELVSSIEPGVPHAVLGDAHRLRQVLTNLAANAVKFTQRGSVTIKARTCGETAEVVTLRFEVIDTGIGIAPEVQSHLFAPFTQADRRMSRLFGGTGLGLSISRRLAVLMKGTIGFQSREGAGSTFWVEVPFGLRAPQTEETPATAVAESLPSSATPLEPQRNRDGELARILLADDHPPNRTIVLQQLRRLGYEADVARDGQEAIDAVRRTRYDLVIMDCVMPNVDGFEATRQIRSWERGAGGHVPIVAMTANAMEGDREACLRAGMDDYIPKPVRTAQLRRIVERYVGMAVS